MLQTCSPGRVSTRGARPALDLATRPVARQPSDLSSPFLAGLLVSPVPSPSILLQQHTTSSTPVAESREKVKRPGLPRLPPFRSPSPFAALIRRRPLAPERPQIRQPVPVPRPRSGHQRPPRRRPRVVPRGVRRHGIGHRPAHLRPVRPVERALGPLFLPFLIGGRHRAPALLVVREPRPHHQYGRKRHLPPVPRHLGRTEHVGAPRAQRRRAADPVRRGLPDEAEEAPPVVHPRRVLAPALCRQRAPQDRGAGGRGFRRGRAPRGVGRRGVGGERRAGPGSRPPPSLRVRRLRLLRRPHVPVPHRRHVAAMSAHFWIGRRPGRPRSGPS
ncbi:hypothetical protein DFJ74DRAFT_144516, partial [Hyaloraphidium curvatum]